MLSYCEAVVTQDRKKHLRRRAFREILATRHGMVIQLKELPRNLSNITNTMVSSGLREEFLIAPPLCRECLSGSWYGFFQTRSNRSSTWQNLFMLYWEKLGYINDTLKRVIRIPANWHNSTGIFTRTAWVILVKIPVEMCQFTTILMTHFKVSSMLQNFSQSTS